MGILYIFSFSYFLLLGNCISEPWYTKLPPNIKVNVDFPLGTYVKREKLKSPLNSKVFKSTINEKIFFYDKKNFQKSYVLMETNGSTKKKIEILGKGEYNIQGSWLLLHTEEMETNIFNTENSLIFNKKERINLKLLYFYNHNKTTILPMVSDTGFKLENYGVKDLIKVPYDDENPFFKNSLNVYSNKDFYSDEYTLSLKLSQNEK